MPDKPSYLGLLNSISLAESAAHCYLTAWAEVTSHDGVRQTLLHVAAREGEHGMSFAKRINELGYQLKKKDDGNLDKILGLVRSDRSDLEKMDALKFEQFDNGEPTDVFDKFFADHTIDIQTGELLGRYIAEERDSGRKLRACYEQVKREAGRSSSASPAIAALESKVDSLCRAVEDLRQVVCAQTMAPAGG
jgi:rubrerythrin